MNIFAIVDASIFAVVLAALMAAACAVGWRAGTAARRAGRTEGSATFEDASIALFGLLLAFTFSIALTKHDHRREMVVAHSNAIGDFYTCATLLDDPVRTKLQGVIKEYTTVLLELARHPATGERFEDTLAKLQAMHGRMTVLVGEGIRSGTPIAVPLTDTLNGVTSAHASRLMAVRDRLPGSIVVLLFFAAVVSSGLVGRQLGVAGNLHVSGMTSFVLLVVLAIYVTLDLNQPRQGLITVSQEPMERLLASMAP